MLEVISCHCLHIAASQLFPLLDHLHDSFRVHWHRGSVLSDLLFFFYYALETLSYDPQTLEKHTR